MKRSYLIILFLFISIFMVSCTNNPETITVTLYRNPAFVYETIEVEANKELKLPIKYTSDDTVYVGWKEMIDDELGEDIFSGTVSFSEDISLMLVEENAADVFVLMDIPQELRPTTHYNIIEMYIGESQYLRIPNMMDGRPIKSIVANAFQNSDLKEVYIPNTITSLGNHTFQGSDQLEYVEFYGTDVSLVEEDFVREYMSSEEFDEILAKNSTACSIDSTVDGVVTYGFACPIIQSELVDTIVIGEEEFSTYEVYVDPTKMLDKYTQSFGIGTFDSCVSLKEVIMPIGERVWGFKDAFTNTPNLTNLVFRDDHGRYKVKDGVVYNLDETVLEYYLPGNQATTFTIPDTVTDIQPQAFYENPYLETIHIGKNTTTIYVTSFYNLDSLEAFNVHEENLYYKSQDGVLFGVVHGTTPTRYGVVKYPANKLGATYTLPETTNFIDKYAFLGNKNLTTLTLNEGLLFIGMYAFWDSVNLTTLDLPASFQYIMPYALEQSSINTVIINGPDVRLTMGKIINNAERLAELEIYVPDEYYDDYLINWSIHTDELKRMSEYQDA